MYVAVVVGRGSVTFQYNMIEDASGLGWGMGCWSEKRFVLFCCFDTPLSSNFLPSGVTQSQLTFYIYNICAHPSTAADIPLHTFLLQSLDQLENLLFWQAEHQSIKVGGAARRTKHVLPVQLTPSVTVGFQWRNVSLLRGTDERSSCVTSASQSLRHQRANWIWRVVVFVRPSTP